VCSTPHVQILATSYVGPLQLSPQKTHTIVISIGIINSDSHYFVQTPFSQASKQVFPNILSLMPFYLEKTDHFLMQLPIIINKASSDSHIAILLLRSPTIRC